MSGYQQLIAALASLPACHCSSGSVHIDQVHRLCLGSGSLKGIAWITKGRKGFNIWCSLGGSNVSGGTEHVKNVPFGLTEEEYTPYALELYLKMDFYWENTINN